MRIKKKSFLIHVSIMLPYLNLNEKFMENTNEWYIEKSTYIGT